MTKVTGFLLQVAGIISFLVSLFPFTHASIAGIIFSICMFAMGTVMWRRGNRGYCEWVSDEEIEGWEWNEVKDDDEETTR